MLFAALVVSIYLPEWGRLAGRQQTMQEYISNAEIIMRESLGLTLNRHLSDLLTPESSFTIMGKLSSLILINVADFSDS